MPRLPKSKYTGPGVFVIVDETDAVETFENGSYRFDKDIIMPDGQPLKFTGTINKGYVFVYEMKFMSRRNAIRLKAARYSGK